MIDKLSSIPNSIRNSLILFLVMILALTSFGIVQKKNEKKLTSLKSQHKKMVETIKELEKQKTQYGSESELEKALKSVETEALNKDKLISNIDDPGKTYDYLMKISNRYCPGMYFDFRKTREGKISKTFYNEYTIYGTVPVRSLFSFISNIELQPRLYTVEQLKIKSLGIEKADTVDFSMMLRAYYSSDGTDVSDIPLVRVDKKNFSYNPFYPRIHPPKPIRDESLLNLEEAVLTGLTSDMAIVEDKKGTLYTLSPGDMVAYGYLKEILWKSQKAIFTINRIGIPETITLSMKEANR